MASIGDRNGQFMGRMAIAIALTTVIAFAQFAALGRSSFTAPWWVHVHGLTMMAWIGLFLAQNLLISTGRFALHRRLGIAGLALSIWMVPVGLLTTWWCIESGRVPPFFEPRFFLALDWLNIVVFAALTWTGIRMRARTDWHRRLILGGTLVLLGPAFGRLVPGPLLGHATVPATSLFILIFLLIAMRHDVRIRGSVHPAHWWTLAAIGLMSVGPFVLSGLVPPLPA